MRGLTRARRQWVSGVASVLVLVAALAAGAFAGGAADDRGKPSHPNFDDEHSEAAIRREAARQRDRENERHSADARRRQTESRTAYRGQSRAEAVALAKREFPQAVGVEPWKPLYRQHGEKVRRFLSDRSALVKEPNGKRLLVESMLPMRSRVRSERPKPVNLRLEVVDGKFRPKNPLVRTEIGARPEDGVDFPGVGYRVRLAPTDNAGGQQDDATVLEDKVFYPDASGLEDTDALVTPAPTGIDYGFQLRAAASPEELVLDFDLPSGARLRMAGDGSGAAEIATADLPGGDILPDPIPDETASLRKEHAIARILPPQAVDADGFQVPASYAVQGHQLTLTVSHRQADTLYPVFVDPILDNYQLDGSGNRSVQGDAFTDWVYTTNASGKFVNSKNGTSGAGLYVAADPGTYSANQYGEFVWTAPRRSYIERADFGYVDHTPANSCVIEGIWGGSKVPAGWDTGSWAHAPAPASNGAHGPSPWYTNQTSTSVPSGYANSNACGTLTSNYKMHCVGNYQASTSTFASCVPGNPPGEPTGSAANSAVLGMIMTGSVATGQRARVFMYGATMWLYDRDIPNMAAPSHSGLPSEWTSSAQITTTLSATEPDPGLGVKKFELILPSKDSPPSTTATANNSCTGDRSFRCPTTWSTTPVYSTDSMPEGVDTIGAKAYDVLGQTGSSSMANWQVKVDRSQPESAQFSGPLWDRRGKLVTSPLSISFTPTDQYSGVKWEKFLVDGSVVSGPYNETCTGSTTCPNTPAARSFTFTPANYSDGQHPLVLQASDPLSHVRDWGFTTLVDNTAPSQPTVQDKPTGGWTRTGTWTSTANSSDHGTAPVGDWGSGILKYELLDGDEVIDTKGYSCDDTITGRCPENPSHPFTYSADGNAPEGISLKEGVRTLSVKAYDNAGHTSDASDSWPVYVDRSSPELTVSDDLTTLDNDDSGRDLFNLHIVATDGVPNGSPSERRSGIQSVQVLVDGTEVYSETPPADCGPDSCGVTTDFLFDTDTVSEGAHEIRVVATDNIGNPSTARQWTIYVAGPNFYADRVAAWKTDIEQRVENATPGPLTGPMPDVPDRWRHTADCEVSEPALRECFNAGNVWREDVEEWLRANLATTLGAAGDLPDPPTFEYARPELARQLTRAVSDAFEIAKRDVVDPTALVNVALSFYEPVDEGTAEMLLAEVGPQQEGAVRSVFDPAGAAILGGHASSAITSVSDLIDQLYATQLVLVEEELGDMQEELATDDGQDADDTADFQAAIDELAAYQDHLERRQPIIKGISVQTTLLGLAGALRSSSVVKAARILPEGASLKDDGGAVIEDLPTNGEQLATTEDAQSSAAAGGATFEASASGTHETCTDRGEQHLDKTDGHLPNRYMPNRWWRQNVYLIGHPDAEGDEQKRNVLHFRAKLAHTLAWYCGDDDGDRGFEAETQVYPRDSERWSTNWEGDADAMTNIPRARQDDLAQGYNGFPPTETEKYPDFSLMTAHARQLRYRKAYFSRYTTNEGMSNDGTIDFNGESTIRANSVGRQIYCNGRGHHDQYCMFKHDETCLGYRLISDGAFRVKKDWSENTYDDDQPICQPVQKD